MGFLPKPFHVGFGQFFSHWYLYLAMTWLHYTSVSGLKHVLKSTTKKKCGDGMIIFQNTPPFSLMPFRAVDTLSHLAKLSAVNHVIGSRAAYKMTSQWCYFVYYRCNQFLFVSEFLRIFLMLFFDYLSIIICGRKKRLSVNL